MAGVLRRLGYRSTSNPRVRAAIARLGLDTSHMTGQGWARGLAWPRATATNPHGSGGPKRRWTDEDLVEAVATETTYAGVMRRLGMRPSGGGHTLVRGHIARLGLDTSHFQGKRWAVGRKFPGRRERPLESYLRKGVLREPRQPSPTTPPHRPPRESVRGVRDPRMARRGARPAPRPHQRRSSGQRVVESAPSMSQLSFTHSDILWEKQGARGGTGRHAGLRSQCPRGLRVRVSPRPLIDRYVETFRRDRRAPRCGPRVGAGSRRRAPLGGAG